MRGFQSDNAAGIHPEVMAALTAEADRAGDSDAVSRWRQVVESRFGSSARSVIVSNGTGANVVGLSAILPFGGVVLTPATAHIHRSESGAVDKVGGVKIVPVPSTDGKLTPALLEQHWPHGRHMVGAVSVTQSTELGTTYSEAELREVSRWAHDRGLLVHMDGARLPHAAAAHGTSLRALSADCGVDVLSLGGTKHGALAAEAVISFGNVSEQALTRVQRSFMQKPPKVRFAAAQMIALFEGGLWRETAHQANAMAKRLRQGLEGVAGTQFAHPTQCNAVIVQLPRAALARVSERFAVNPRSAVKGFTRLMTSWDTTEEDVEALIWLVRAGNPRVGV